MSMKPLLRRLALLLVATLVLAACGGDDDGGDPADDTADDAATEAAADDGDDAGSDAGSGGGGALDVDAILEQAGEDCAAEPTGDPLVIGYAADFSEVGGYADQPGSQAAQFMAELVNCAGGVDGSPIEVLVEDIQGDPDVTQRAAQDLLDAGVHALLGPPFSDFGLPLLQVVNGQVPTIFVASTEVLLADADSDAYIMAFDDPAQSRAAAQFAIDEGFATAVTLSSPDAPYFQQNPQMFAEAFEELGGEVLGDYTYSLADSDFSSQVNQIAALDPAPDVIYTSMIMPLTGTLLGQLDGAGVEAAIIGADSFDATSVVGAGDVADGVYYTTHGFPSEGSRMAAFLDAYEARNGEPLETISFGTLAADAVLLIADAWLRAGGAGTEPPAIAEAIEATEDLELITEAVTYAGTTGVPLKPVFIHQIQDGEPTLATVIEP